MKKKIAAGVFLLTLGVTGAAQAEDFTPGIQGLTDAEMTALDSDPAAMGIEFGRVYECRARNGRGQVFEAQARSRSQARRRALNHCYSYRSHRCDIVSCKGKWAIGFGDGRNDSRWDDRWDDGSWGRDRDHDRRGRGGRGRR